MSNIQGVEQANINCVDEDEIDLRELWETIKKGKMTIFITMFIVVSLTFVYVLKMPNSYKSEAVLIPSKSGGASSSGLGGLAAMAGISLGGGTMTPDIAFQSLLNDYVFMKNFVQKNGIVSYYSRDDADKNYVFAFGFRGLYDLLHSKGKKEVKDKSTLVFNTVKRVKGALSISSDKKSGLITISYTDPDRTYAPKVVNMFLKDASAYLVQNNLKNINKRLKYFQEEISKVEAFELRQSLSQMISQILKEKVMMQSKEYYKCDLLTAPYAAYIKNKAKPKRGLILVVSFVTSMILGIFLVFFMSFIKENKNKDEEQI